jgi:hypothetical protein
MGYPYNRGTSYFLFACFVFPRLDRQHERKLVAALVCKNSFAVLRSLSLFNGLRYYAMHYEFSHYTGAINLGISTSKAHDGANLIVIIHAAKIHDYPMPPAPSIYTKRQIIHAFCDKKNFFSFCPLFHSSFIHQAFDRLARPPPSSSLEDDQRDQTRVKLKTQYLRPLPSPPLEKSPCSQSYR